MPLSSSAQFEKQKRESVSPGGGQYMPAQPNTPAPQSSQEWDYKTSPVNQRGEQLPAGAEGWTPFGQPYFGKGLSGTLKRYKWMLMGSPTQGTEEERWARFTEITDQSQGINPYSPEAQKLKQEGSGLMLGGLFGTQYTQESKQTDWNKVKEASARIDQIKEQYGTQAGTGLLNNDAPDSVKQELQELQKTLREGAGAAAEGATSFQFGGQQVSLLSPLLKTSKVMVQAVMDALSELSVKTEQMQGVNLAMREYADEQGNLPDLAFDINRQNDVDASAPEFWNDPTVALKSEEAQNMANIASRLLVAPLTSWDAFRFWTAPGTLKEKQKVISEGWDAGRILYSQAIKPSLLSEYKRRAAAGEDPQLLAMELQNPWAEAVGQAVLDPLNFIGMGAKTAKIANRIDNATDAVRGGTLGDEAAELMKDAQNLGETRAAERFTKFDDLLVKSVDRIENARLTPDYNKLTAYSPSGMRVRESKVVATTSQVVTSSIMRNGGSADDVADFFHNLAKATSKDKTARLGAWDELFTMSKRFGLGRYAMSDDVLETGILLRNLTEDKDLLTILKAGKGDLAETAKILDRTFKRAVEKQIPTYSEVKKGAEAFKTGADTSKRAEQLAETFGGIKNKAAWNLHEGRLGDFKQKVNSTLGKFFFAQPGFVARNASNNFVTMFVDEGLSGTARSYYRDGKFWSMSAIEDDLMKYFGGKLPPATGGITSLSQAEDASTFVTRLNEKVESGFAKRIYWSRFRDTMDKFLTPGVALPTRQEFQAAGMTDDAINHFTHILKNEAHGSVEQAITKYTEKFGESGILDTWKRWNGSVSADEMKGLSEVGLTKEIDDIVGTAKTPQEIKERIAKLKTELQNRANSATDNPIGVNRERQGFEFMEGMGKATKDGLIDADGTSRLSILIEQSEKASDELMQALGKARDTTQDPALRQQFSTMEEAFSSTRRGSVRDTSRQLTDTAWDFTRRSKKSTNIQAEKLWNDSILAKTGPAPAGLTPQQFRDELWKATRNDVSNTWEVYFSEGFDRLTPLVDNLSEQFPELQGIFAKSRKASAELNMYRTAVYRDGKIFYSVPPRNVSELANRYGVSSATEAGVPKDKQLLATINKYSDRQFKNLQEAEDDLTTVERALQNRQAAKGTADFDTNAQQTIERYMTTKGFKPEDIPPDWHKLPEEELRKSPATIALLEYKKMGQPIPGVKPAELSLGIDEAEKAADLEYYKKAFDIDAIKAKAKKIRNPEVQIQPPYVDGSTPIPGQMWKENSDGVLATLNKVEQYMLDNYGLKAAEKLDGSQVKAMKKLMQDYRGRTTEAIAIADKVGKEWRDFALLPYGETKNFDLALSYVFPYQFWYSRSYTNWMKRVATDPQVIANYARLKEAMSKINSESPEWWRYNLEVPAHFLGLPNEHPMSFNLEANLWPLYGLTGTDFNDPRKRTNWLTATVDDMGKMGPSVWSPVQWAVALYYRGKGEEELAQSWAGRVIPQTATIKAVSSYFGQPIETDPAVQLFSGKGIMDFGAMDKYERNRVGRALTAMVQDGLITNEQAVEVARTQDGPVWDEATRRATQLRAPGQIASYFFGVGMKARTEEDRVTDEFYQKYYRLQNLNEAGLISPTEYQKNWDTLRNEYPFMDALLLSRKAGPDRDRAYAYNVLGRIPPGQASELYKLVGIDPKTAQKFYDSKGDLSGMSEPERDKFMAAMVDLGAQLSIPELATKNEWTDARNAYKGIQEQMKSNFGDDIQEKIDHYYSIEDGDQRKAFLETNPEIQQALAFQNEQIVNDDLLYEYYGGIAALEKYHKNKMYDQLYAKFGEDISKTWDEYYSMQLTDPTGAKRFYRQHPELKAYSREKKILEEQALRAVVEFGSKLPEAPPPELTGNEPQSVAQENIQNYATQQTQPLEFWQAEMPEVTAVLADYWTEGGQIPYAVTKNLDYMAYQYGYEDGDALLQAILISMNR